MPFTAGAKARVDILAAAEWIAKYSPSTAYVERAQAFPGQGVVSIPMVLVEGSVWKRQLRLPGKDKERQGNVRCNCSPAPTRAACAETRSWKGRSRTPHNCKLGARFHKRRAQQNQEKKRKDDERLMKIWRE